MRPLSTFLRWKAFSLPVMCLHCQDQYPYEEGVKYCQSDYIILSSTSQLSTPAIRDSQVRNLTVPELWCIWLIRLGRQTIPVWGCQLQYWHFIEYFQYWAFPIAQASPFHHPIMSPAELRSIEIHPWHGPLPVKKAWHEIFFNPLHSWLIQPVWFQMSENVWIEKVMSHKQNQQ